MQEGLGRGGGYAAGYTGAYDIVQRHVRQWKIEAGRATGTKAFVPQFLASGDVAQFDRSCGPALPPQAGRKARSGTRPAAILDNDPREGRFTPAPRFADFAARNAWACDPLPGTGRASPPHSICHDRRDLRVGTADAAAGQHAV